MYVSSQGEEGMNREQGLDPVVLILAKMPREKLCLR